jgi:hypothetical protein
MQDRPGCLSGFLKLFLLDRLFDWGQSRFGFKRGGCLGIGCGVIMLIVFIAIACSIVSGTNWFKLF